MKRSTLAMSVLALVAGGAVTTAALAQASRQTAADPRPATTETARSKGMAEAPAVVARAGLTCQVADARFIGSNRQRNKENKMVVVSAYEVACAEGLGFILIDTPGDPKPESYDCLAQRDSVAASGGKGVECELEANKDVMVTARYIAASAGLKCDVARAQWIGRNPQRQVDFYEFLCADRPGGFWVNRPSFGTEGKAEALHCLNAAAAGYQCKIADEAERLKVLHPMLVAAGGQCVAEKGRWVGRSPSSGHEFFEVACASGDGLMLESRDDYSLVRALNCLQAEGIGGGCKLTDTSRALAAVAQQTADKLRGAGVACTAVDQRVIGEEVRLQRDVFELKCPEQPNGLIAFVPRAGATSKIEVRDCLQAEGVGLKCELTPRSVQMARLNPLIQGRRADCEVENYAVIGLHDEGMTLEIACANGRGYISDINGAATRMDAAQPCHIAAQRGPYRCMIPGNGRAQGLE